MSQLQQKRSKNSVRDRRTASVKKTLSSSGLTVRRFKNTWLGSWPQEKMILWNSGKCKELHFIQMSPKYFSKSSHPCYWNSWWVHVFNCRKHHTITAREFEAMSCRTVCVFAQQFVVFRWQSLTALCARGHVWIAFLSSFSQFSTKSLAFDSFGHYSTLIYFEMKLLYLHTLRVKCFLQNKLGSIRL